METARGLVRAQVIVAVLPHRDGRVNSLVHPLANLETGLLLSAPLVLVLHFGVFEELLGRGGLFFEHVPENVRSLANRLFQLPDLLLLAPENVLKSLARGLILLKLPSGLGEAALLAIDAFSHFNGLSLKFGLVVLVLGFPVLGAGEEAQLRRVHVPSAALRQAILLPVHRLHLRHDRERLAVGRGAELEAAVHHAVRLLYFNVIAGLVVVPRLVLLLVEERQPAARRSVLSGRGQGMHRFLKALLALLLLVSLFGVVRSLNQAFLCDAC